MNTSANWQPVKILKCLCSMRMLANANARIKNFKSSVHFMLARGDLSRIESISKKIFYGNFFQKEKLLKGRKMGKYAVARFANIEIL